MGRIGMSLDDFDRCGPSEFRAILKAWNEGEQDRWERMRIHAALSIMPWAKKGVRPSDLCPLPWDDGKHGGKAPEVSREEAKKRYERLMNNVNGGKR